MPGRSRALVFAGAGASFAVDRINYPTTVGFFERLPSDIREHPLVRHLTNQFESKFGSGEPDVEKLLWCLEELLDHAKRVNDASSAVSWVLPNNYLRTALSLSHDVNGYSAAAHQAVPKLKSLKDDINAAIYDCYAAIPAKDRLEETWLHLLNGLNLRGYWVDLITTNYDLVIEEAARVSGLEIGYGRQGFVVPSLDVEVWQKGAHEPSHLPYRHGLITKLHGSLNWERGREGKIEFGGTTYKSRHEHHVVIYPGFKGEPKDEPFGSFHTYFESALRDADLVVFIGFAFRDEYINAVINRSLQAVDVWSINPIQPKLPAAIPEFRNLNFGFGKEGIDELFATLAPVPRTTPME